MTVLFVQPFGIASAGGGARILRSMLDGAPVPVFSVCTTPDPPPPADGYHEAHVPARPSLGRLDRTRLRPLVNALEVPFERRLQRALIRVGRERDVRAIHAVAHGGDFWAALGAARALDVPFFLSIHDDVRYAMWRNPHRGLSLARLARAWRDARFRFTITEAMGEEYDRRFGPEDWTVVTDGIESMSEPGRGAPTPSVYFMGSLHISYEPNVRALLAALVDARSSDWGRGIELVCRGSDPRAAGPAAEIVRTLPFGGQEAVSRDIASASLLYLPLPLGSDHADFIHFSLPTKMVSYLAGARPILYHGPSDSAAARMLSAARAAVVVDSLDPRALVGGIREALDRSDDLAQNGLELARREFDIGEIRRRFWTPFEMALAQGTGS